MTKALYYPTPQRQRLPLSDENFFWNIIATFDLTQDDPEDVIAVAVEKLAEAPVSRIQDFQDRMDYKLKLFRDQHAPHFNWYCAELAFLYVSLGVIAKGREHYEQALENPDWEPGEFNFQPLYTLANEAYERKTGLPDLRFRQEETFSR